MQSVAFGPHGVVWKVPMLSHCSEDASAKQSPSLSLTGRSAGGALAYFFFLSPSCEMSQLNCNTSSLLALAFHVRVH